MIEVLTQPFVEELENGERRPRALWRILAQYVLFLVALSLFTVPVSLVLGAGTAVGGGALQGNALLVGSVASLFAAFVAVWLVGRFLDRRPLRGFGLRLDTGWWLDLGFGLALGAALMTAIFAVEAALGWVSVTGVLEPGAGGGPFWLSILGPVTLFLCVGIYEELLFRGYQIKNISEGLGGVIGPRGAIVAAWVLTSALFAAGHIANPNSTVVSTVNIGLAGLMLGAGYVLTGQLAIPIGLHVTWNFFQANVYGFPVSGIDSANATFISTEQGGPEAWTGGAFGPEAGIVTVFATLTAILLILLWTRLRTGGSRLHLPLAEPPGADRKVRGAPPE